MREPCHEGTRKLQLWWTERDGPPVEKPSRKGFGSSLIQRLLTTQCRAEIEFAYDRPGLRFQMSVPLVRSARDEIMTLRPGEPSSPGRHSPDGGMIRTPAEGVGRDSRRLGLRID